MYVHFTHINTNIGHFVHQELHVFLKMILDKSSIILLLENYIKSDIYRWHHGILSVIEKTHPHVTIQYIDKLDNNLEYLINMSPTNPETLDLDYLRNIIFDYYQIPIKQHYMNKYVVVYTRKGDTNRRHILNADILTNIDLIINSTDMTFEEQVNFFSKISHYISVEGGADFANIMFMQPCARALTIRTRIDFSEFNDRDVPYDSWQRRFGTYKMIKEFNLDEAAINRVHCNTESDHAMHDHVIIDPIMVRNITNWLSKDILVIKHDGYHGFFSYCSISMQQIIEYYCQNNYFPIKLDMSNIFTTFKSNNNDISSIFFKQNTCNILDSFNANNDALHMLNRDIQFTNYKLIDYNIISPIIDQYFIFSDEISNIVQKIEQSYNINYSNTCCIFYRGNDKNTETLIPSYDTMYLKYNELLENSSINTILQSDESEFFNFFTNKIKNYTIFNNEIKHIPKQQSSINHIYDVTTRLELIKNFLAIVYIMSKCKYIICTSGNISLWVTYFRKNSYNVYQYLNNSWV